MDRVQDTQGNIYDWDDSLNNGKGGYARSKAAPVAAPPVSPANALGFVRMQDGSYRKWDDAADGGKGAYVATTENPWGRKTLAPGETAPGWDKLPEFDPAAKNPVEGGSSFFEKLKSFASDLPDMGFSQTAGVNLPQKVQDDATQRFASRALMDLGGKPSQLVEVYKQRFPQFQWSIEDGENLVATDPNTGKKAVVDARGFGDTAQSWERGAAQAVPFLIGTALSRNPEGGAVATEAAATLPRLMLQAGKEGAMTGLKGGLIREAGIEAPARSALGQPQDTLNQSLGDIAFDTAAGFGGGAVGQTMFSGGRKALETLGALPKESVTLTPDAIRAAAEKAGIDPRTIHPDTLAEAARRMTGAGKLADPLQALRMVEAERVGGKLNTAQVRDDQAMRDTLAALDNQTINPEGRQRILDASQAQRDALDNALAQRNLTTPDRPGLGPVQERLSGERQAAYDAKNAAYDKVPNGIAIDDGFWGDGASISTRGNKLVIERDNRLVNDLTQKIKDANIPLADDSASKRTIAELRKLGVRSAAGEPTTVGDLRTALGNLSDAKPGADMKAAAVIRDAFNFDKGGYWDELAKGGHLVGDEATPNPGELLANANALAKQYGDRWERSAGAKVTDREFGTNADTGAAGSNLRMDRTKVAESIFGGRDGISNIDRPALTDLAGKLPKDSPEFASLRNEGLYRIGQMIDRANTPAQLDRVSEVIMRNRDSLGSIFNDSDLPTVFEVLRYKQAIKAPGAASAGDQFQEMRGSRMLGAGAGTALGVAAGVNPAMTGTTGMMLTSGIARKIASGQASKATDALLAGDPKMREVANQLITQYPWLRAILPVTAENSMDARKRNQ